jgi:hypothetical protein
MYRLHAALHPLGTHHENLVFDPPVVEMGDMAEGEQRHRRVLVRNQSGVALKILEVAPSCGCTVGTLSARTIAAGGSATLDVAFDATYRRGEEHEVVDLTAAPLAPGSRTIHSQLSVTARVHREAWAQPNPLDFGRVDFGTEPVRSLTLYGAKSTRWLPRIQNSAANELVLRHLGPRHGAATRVEVRLRPRGRSGRRECKLLIQPAPAAVHSIPVQVQFDARSRFDVSPAAVNFGILDLRRPAGSLVRVVRRVSSAGRPVGILKAPKWVRASIEWRHGEAYLSLQVDRGRLKRGRALNDTVEIQTSDRLEPVITLPVMAIVS